MRYLLLFVFFLSVIVSGCHVDTPLPKNAVILKQNIYVDEIENGTPQTIVLANGKGVTWKMPKTLHDGQLLKVRDVKGEPPYYIKITIIKREPKTEKKDKK
ncbi:hypothetical protein KAH37_08295 [bacterium]|nr:hypothetical protein [bacterium]